VNIVIVDDEKLIREGMSYIIRQMNADDVVVALLADGEEALNFCLREGARIDVLLTDVCMPNMDGLDLIAELSRSCPHIQSIVMSGFGEFDYVRRAMRDGASDYLLKPVIPNELKAVMDRIRNRQASAALAGDPVNREVSLGSEAYRDNLLNALFHVNPGLAGDARRYLEERCGIGESRHSFLAAGVAIDALPGHSFQQADRMLFRYFIRKMAEEALFESGRESGLTWQGQNDIVVLLFFVHKGMDNREVVASLNGLLFQLASQVQYPVTIGLSSEADTFSEFPRLLMEAKESLRARLTLGTDQVIRHEDCLNLQRQWSVQPDGFDKVVTATVIGDTEMIKRELNVLLADMHQASIDPEVLLDVLLRLFLRVENVMKSSKVNPGEAAGTDLSKLIGDLRRCPTWSSLESEVLDKLTAWSEMIREQTMQTKPAFINDAVNYIHAHFASDLTLAEAAEVVGMYPTYLSEQFKLHMGVKFVDYVIQVRMDKAKKLLRETTKPSFEISEKVGYATPAHFAKVFKSKVGCTPSEYREGWKGLRKQGERTEK